MVHTAILGKGHELDLSRVREQRVESRARTGSIDFSVTTGESKLKREIAQYICAFLGSEFGPVTGDY